MTAPNGIERRDPVSGLLRLGRTLALAGHRELTCEVRVEDDHQTHILRLIGGFVADVVHQGRAAAPQSPIRSRACALFDLRRPLVTVEDSDCSTGRLHAVHPEQVVLLGVLRRQDLFDPRPLVTRIPVNTLRLKDEGLVRVRSLGLSPEELDFVKRLRTPTPATLALWKRGLLPRHAAALVMALNLLDCFDEWQAGDLPRRRATAALERKLVSGVSDHELLGISKDADAKDIDRALRRLSFELHPDRAVDLPTTERRRAEQRFRDLTEAHARLKRSRRAPTVRHRTAADSEVRAARSGETWRPLFEKSRAAAGADDRYTARAYALKALAASPPPEIVASLKALIRSVA